MNIESCMAWNGLLQSALKTIDVTRTGGEGESIERRIVELRESASERSDEALAARCRAADHDAFTELVDRYKHKVHWIVLRMVGDVDAEDLTQEVFLRAYQALPGFRGDSKFSTWLYKIARNLCLSELRRRGRHGGELQYEEESEEKIRPQLQRSPESLAEQIERHDLSREVRRLIERLPEHYRVALTLFYVNQARYEEIAEIMEIPMGTVKTYVRRARLRLRELLLEEPDLAGLTGGFAEEGGPKEGGSS